MQNIFIDILPPWVETGLQPAFYDLESGPVLQQTARMYAKVKELTEAFNTLSTDVTNEINQFEQDTNDEIERFEGAINDTVEEYIGKFNDLHDYVEDYFENLDVQEEIDNKLDEMIEDGTLQPLLSAYSGYVSVKSFGAKGDGTTNDTTAFQNAIDYATTNGIKLYVDKGIYLVSKLTISSKITMEGAGIYDSTIKSIDNNTNTDGVLTVEGYGILNSIFRNFGINGNKDNQDHAIHGFHIKMNNGFDTNAIIDTIFITKCSGTGLFVDGYAREIRFSKISSSFNDLYGIYIKNSTDHLMDTLLCYSNTKHGIYFTNSGSTKIVNCKCYQNGHSDEPFTDINRLPTSAFSITTDESPQAGTTYYTRSGSGKWYSPYRYTEFTGDTFDGGTDYYVITNGNYRKKYCGMCFEGSHSIALTSIEVQDNGGDGIHLDSCREFTMNSIITDCNGLLKVNGVNKKYSDYSMSPLYDGIFIKDSGYIDIESVARNFRGLDLGYIQRSGLGCDTAYQVNARLAPNLDMVRPVTLENPDLKNFNVLVNGHEHEFVYDVNDLTNVPNGYNIYNGSYDKSYIKRVGNVIYMRMMFTKTGGNIPVDISDLTMFKVPVGWIPDYMVNIYGFLSQDHGNHWSGNANIKITNNGMVTYVPASDTPKEYLVIQGEYPLNY